MDLYSGHSRGPFKVLYKGYYRVLKRLSGLVVPVLGFGFRVLGFGFWDLGFRA